MQIAKRAARIAEGREVGKGFDRRDAGELPIFAELVVDDSAADAPPARGASDVEIVIGDIVIRAGAGADEGQLTRAIRAARAAAS